MMHPAGDNSARYRGNYWAKSCYGGGTCQVRVWIGILGEYEGVHQILDSR